MKYETPMIEIIKLDYIFTLYVSGGESTGENEDNNHVGGWVPR